MFVWQRSIVDGAGNVVPGASVEVRDSVTDSLVQLYSDVDGNVAIGNPIEADPDGFVRFYAGHGRYDVNASSDGLFRTWADVRLGTSGTDIEYEAIPTEAGVTIVNKFYPPGHVLRYGTNTTPGTTPMRAAIVAALAVGRETIFPDEALAVSSVIPLNSGASLRGSGYASRVTSTGNGIILFSASSKANIKIKGLRLHGDGNVGSQALKFTACTNVVVDGNRFENCKNHVVDFFGTSDSRILNNTFADSAVNPATDNHSTVGSDIRLRDNSKRNLVAGNTLVSGGATAIAVISETAGADPSDNIIEGNLIQDYNIYGIMVYRSNAGDEVLHNSVVNNRIDSITGDIKHLTDGDVYGAGVYVQGAEHTLVTGNMVSRSNLNNAGTVLGQLAPAGIGVANASDVTVSNNKLVDCKKYGVRVVNSFNGANTGRLKVCDNTVLNSGDDGIRIEDSGSLDVLNNYVQGTDQGIVVDATSTVRHLVKVAGNTVVSSAGSGIIVRYIEDLQVDNNYALAGAGSGIVIDACNQFSVRGNDVDSCTVRGIHVQSASTNGLVAGNHAYDCATGIELGAAVTHYGNRYHNNAINLVGGPEVLTAGTVTADVTVPVSQINSSSGVVTVTCPNGQYEGQTKVFQMNSAINPSTVSVTSHETSNPEVFTFAQVGDYLVLRWSAIQGKWWTEKNIGVTV